MRIYIVQKGDTLFEIAKNNGATLEEVMKLNPQLSSPDLIMPGMKIKIPSGKKQIKSDKEYQVKSQGKTAKSNERPIGRAMKDDKSVVKNDGVLPISQAPKKNTPLDKKSPVSSQRTQTDTNRSPTKRKEFPQTMQAEHFPPESMDFIRRQWNQQPPYAQMPVSSAMRPPMQEMRYPPMMCPCCFHHMMMPYPYPMQMNRREFSFQRPRRSYCPYS